MMGDSIELMMRGGILAAADKQSKKAQKPGKAQKRSGKAGPADAQLGKVLRSVYQQAVDEAVPQEMLDLLNKLD